MKSLILVLLISFSANIFASDFVNGEGRFFAKDEDSLTFVKRQLLYSAFRDVFSKELQSMGLDAELFWRKLDTGFQEYFDPIDEKLKNKYSIGEDGETPRKKELYENAIRAKRLTLKAKFGRLSRAINSYSIQKMSRSTQIANSRYLSLQAKVNRPIVNKIYLEYTRDKFIRQFNNLFVSVKIDLAGMGWTDVGVETEADFVDVVSKHWKQWFEERLNSHISEVQITSADMESRLQEFIKIPSVASETLNSIAIVDNESQEDETQKQVESVPTSINPLENSLWLQVNISMKKKGENTLLKQRDYELEGDFVLIDLKNNALTAHYDFSKEKKSYSYEDAHKLSSNLASLVYRLPMKEFNNFKAKLDSLPADQGKIRLKITNVNSIQDLLMLKKELASKGVTYQLNPKISSYSSKQGNVTISYQGDNTQMISFLLSMENTNIGPTKKIFFPSKENPFELVLLDVEVEEDPLEKEVKPEVEEEKFEVEKKDGKKPTKA